MFKTIFLTNFLVFLIIITGCEKPRQISPVTRFYHMYYELEMMGEETSLNNVLGKLSKKDSDSVQKILLDYNHSDSENWLAKFKDSSGNLTILFKDGSLKLVINNK